MNEINKIIRMVIISVIVLILLIALITGSNILFFWSIFDWLQNSVQSITGLDAPLAKAIAAIFTAVIVMLPLGKIFMSFTPIPQKDSGSYRSILFVCMAIFFLFTYFGAKDTYFDIKTGEALKYYSVLPNGEYKFYSEPGFDPVTGDELKVVTKEIVLKSKGISKREEFNYYRPPTPKTESHPKSAVINYSSPKAVPEVNPDLELSNNKYAVPKQVDPLAEITKSNSNSNAEETTRNTEDYEGKCLVTFKNIGQVNLVVLNTFREELCQLGANQNITLNLNPGKYYFKGFNKNSSTALLVPKKKFYSISLRVNQVVERPTAHFVPAYTGGYRTSTTN